LSWPCFWQAVSPRAATMIQPGPPGPAPWAGSHRRRHRLHHRRGERQRCHRAWVGAAAAASWVAWAGRFMPPTATARSAQPRLRPRRITTRPGQRGERGQRHGLSGMARPGQQLALGVDYTILTPENMPVSATLVREIRYQGNLVGRLTRPRCPMQRQL